MVAICKTVLTHHIFDEIFAENFSARQKKYLKIVLEIGSARKGIIFTESGIWEDLVKIIFWCLYLCFGDI